MLKTFLFIIFFSFSLNADVLRENYLTINTNNSNLEAILDFESDYLDKTIKTDLNNNEIVSWKELKSKKNEIIAYTLGHVKISSDGKECLPVVKDFVIHRLVEQSYIKLFMDFDCKSPQDTISIKYDLFFDIDSSEKLFITIDNNSSKKPWLLSSHKNSIDIDLKEESIWQSFINFVIEGIWHIWIGFDHILFLLMLLVFSVSKVDSKYKEVLFEVLKIVTAFSIAHSITLVLSVLNIIEANMRWIEIFIAISVLVTALNNIFKVVKKDIWVIAFVFGLIHGFGFANVLKELILNSSTLTSTLLGFNLGVEIGQVAIVLVVVPLLYYAKESRFYKNFFVYGISFLTAIVSLLWIYERY